MAENVYTTAPDARATWSVNRLVEADRDDLLEDLVEDIAAEHTQIPTPVLRGRVAGHRVALRRRRTTT